MLMFVAIFFLFQGPQIIRQTENPYNVNTNRSKSLLQSTDVWDSDPAGKDEAVSGDDISNNSYAVYVGPTDTELYKTCREWAFYTKRKLKTYIDIGLYSLPEKGEQGPDLILLDGRDMTDQASVSKVQSMLDAGLDVVFCRLPSVSEMKKSQIFQELIGIYYIRQDLVHAKGIHLYEGLLLGGERIYEADSDQKEEQERQDLNLDVPWLVPDAGTRTYMTADVDKGTDQRMTAKDMPALIWRKSFERAMLFVVNGDYLDDRLSGIGILDGFVSDARDYELYPVINAQNLVLTGFPELADENAAEMEKIYGLSQTELEKNIMLPAIEAAVGKAGFRITAMVLPQYSYTDQVFSRKNTLAFYLRQLREQDGEAGISFQNSGEVSVSDLKTFVAQTLQDQAEGYDFGAVYIPGGDLKQAEALLSGKTGETITTVATDYQSSRRIFSYFDTNRTVQPLLSDASTHTYQDDLDLLGAESAFGYTSISMNLVSTLWPQDREDRWENLSDRLFSNLSTYWKDFSAFDSTTLSQSDSRLRTFLALDYQDEIQDQDGRTLETFSDGENIIRLKVKNFGKSAWFLLRMHGKSVVHVTDGTAVKIEDGVYLIGIHDADTAITVKESA
ncbi:MAG: DUF2194 domain-containing protein [Bilifractor sp.]